MNDIHIGDSIIASQDDVCSYILTVSDLRITNGVTLYYGNYSKYHNGKLCHSFDAGYWSWFDDSVFTVILNEFDLGI